MQLVSQSVGLDIAKDSFVAFIEAYFSDRSAKKIAQRKFDNAPAGIKSFIKWLSEKTKSLEFVHLTMEATGRYHENLAYALLDHNYRISIVLPNRIKNFARSLNEYSKTDPIDARIIASYTSMHNPGAWQPANKSMRHLRELTRERQDLMKMRTQAKNRLSALRSGHKPLKETMRRIKKQIAFFDKQVEQIEIDTDRLRQNDEQLNRSIELLTSIPHIKDITAYVLMAETNGFTLFENRNQLIKYAGLDIIERQSGTSLNGRSCISKRGNSHLRSAPYMGAMGVKRTQSVFQETYLRAVGKGQAKKQAFTAVVRQLIRVAYGVHKSGQPYEENTHRLRTPKGVGEFENSPTVTHLGT